MQNEKLIEQLKKLREENGWSLERMAAEIGVTLQTIWRWENDKVNPSPLALEKIKSLLME